MDRTGDPLLAFVLLLVLVGAVIVLELPKRDPTVRSPFGRDEDADRPGRHR